MSFLSDFWNTVSSSADTAISRIYHTPSKQWVAQFAPAAAAPGLTAVEQIPILPMKHYVTVTAQKTVLPYDRILFKSFYAAVHSTILVRDDSGEVRSLSTFSSLDPALTAIDKHAGERMVQGPRTLLEYAPFRGSQFASTIALLAIEAVDYAKPLLSTLQTLSSVAGFTFFSAAAPLAEPLLTGIQALAEVAGGSGTQIVYAGNLPLHTGIFLVAATDTAAFDWADYSFTADYTLCCRGTPVSGFPYMVLTIAAADARPNWKQIPSLRAAEDALDQAVRSAGRKIAIDGSEEQGKVEDALLAFRWACINCEDLCPDDAARVADLARTSVQDLIAAGAGGLKKLSATRSLDEVSFDAPAKTAPSGFSLDNIALFPRPR
jgi:hypothetical protein